MRIKLRFHAATATPLSLAVILLLAVAGLLVVLSDGQAQASNVSCGDTITTDATLHRSLVNCPNNGIIIGADDVTLDLNYHRLDGDGTPAAGCNPRKEICDVGVDIEGHDGVAVVHGSVREFGYGVFVGRARHNRVLGISSSRNLLFGFVVANSARSVVRGCSGSRNLPPEGDGMGLFSSHHVRIVHNSFRRNGQLGIHVFDSTRILIKGNVISRNPSAIELEADRNEVRRNRVARNGNGIGIAGNRNIIRRNRVDASKGAAGGFGIPLEHGDHNLVARNSALPLVTRSRRA